MYSMLTVSFYMTFKESMDDYNFSKTISEWPATHLQQYNIQYSIHVDEWQLVSNVQPYLSNSASMTYMTKDSVFWKLLLRVSQCILQVQAKLQDRKLDVQLPGPFDSDIKRYRSRFPIKYLQLYFRHEIRTHQQKYFVFLQKLHPSLPFCFFIHLLSNCHELFILHTW